MTLWFRLCVFCGLLLLGACSSTTLVYNRLDFLIPWYLGDYADLNREQKKHLDELLVPFLSWHRAKELPRYVEILDRIRADLEGPVQAEDIAAFVNDFRVAWLRVEDEGLEWMLALGEKLSDEQMDEFIAAFWEQNEEYSQEYLPRSDEEFYDESYDNLKENTSDYVGRLSKQQKATARAASRKLLRSDGEWLADQGNWIRQLEKLLVRDEGWQERVRSAVAARPDELSAEYVKVIEHNSGVIQVFTAQLLNDLSEKQERQLQKKLDKLREDLNKLAAQGKPAQKITPTG